MEYSEAAEEEGRRYDSCDHNGEIDNGGLQKLHMTPRRRKTFHLVGLPDWHKLDIAPRKRKIFHLMG